MEKDIILRGPELKLERKSFGQVFFNSLRNGGDQIAMVNGSNDESLTYNELLNKSISLSFYLQQNRLSKNDSISICSENNLIYPIPAISALYLGISVASICADLTENELIHIFKLAKSKILFCSLKTYETVVKASYNFKCIKKIILLDGNTRNLPNYVESLDNILELNTNYIDFKPANIDVNHNAFIFFSSGTTGLPKGVIMTNKNLNAAHSYNAYSDYGDFNSNKVGLTITAFNFAFGLIRVMSMLISHMKIVVLPKFNPQLYLSSIEKYRITNIFLTPALVLFMARSPLVGNYDLSSIQEIMSGTTALKKDTQEMVYKRLKIGNIRQGYGLTETLAITLSPKNNVKPGSAGVLVPGKECKIIDVDTGKSLGPHKQGELYTRGPHVMKGYVDNPEATAAIIDNDGWCRTGDAAFYDEDGYLYIVDRYKELIKFKGFQVPPAEIEDLLLSHPEIVDCAVVGKPDERFDELPTAFVVKQENAKLTENDVIEFVAKNISYQKRLHGGVRFVQNIPRNPIGKILKRVLKEQLLTSKL